MLRRPGSRSSSLAAKASSSYLSPLWIGRQLSTSPPLQLRGRIKPEREMFPKSERVNPMTKREIEDKEMTEQLTAEAGTTWKERLSYGITRQTEYFTKEAMRMDREKATKSVLEGLPPLTEKDIDDFYVNLMASGNELSNLPALASPNRTAASIEEQKKFILQHESKEQEKKRLQTEENIRLIQEGVNKRQRMLLEAHSVVQPQRAFGSQREATGRIEQGEEQEEQMLERIGVQSRGQEKSEARRLEVNEDGEAVDQEDESRFAGSFGKFSSPSSFEESLRPASSSSTESAPTASSSQPSTSSSSSPRTTSDPSSTQSFEERYPHATRLSSSSYPPSSTITSNNSTEESAFADSTPSTSSSSSQPRQRPRSSSASPLKSTTTSSPPPPPQQLSSPSPPTSITTRSLPAFLSLSSPSSSSDLSLSTYPSTFTQLSHLPPHLLPASSSFLPPPTPLLLSLEQSILAAEEARAITTADHYSSPDYLSLPPLDPILHGPPSPIQPHASFLKGAVRAKHNATTFPGEASSSPPVPQGVLPATTRKANPNEVRLPIPLPTDVRKRLRSEGAYIKPIVLPLGLITQGEWKSVVYKTLKEPERLEVEWKEGRRRAGGARGELAVKMEKKREMKERLREEHNKRMGRLPMRGKEEQARSLQKAGYALLAAKGLELMVRSGSTPELSWFLDILKVLSDAGDVNGVQMVITQSEKAGFPANYSTYSHLVLAHLGLSDLHGAVATLHNLESRSLYPLESTYRALIQPLVHSDIDAHRATGWDLFAHMRLVAHPIPSKETYDMIIEACSNVNLPEPERALDLWTEMTIENKVPPDVTSFNAIIRAVGSSKKFYLESFRLMRQMLDFYHTSVPDSAQRAMYTPDRRTFDNLLIGAKKNGDIARTRWIMTEMIRFSNHPGMKNDGADISPTASTMVSIFQAYAAARPNIRKGDLNFAEAQERERLLRVEEGETSTAERASSEAVEVMEEEETKVEEMTVEVGGTAWEDGGDEDFTGEEDWTVIDSETLQDALDVGRVPSEAEAAESDAWSSFDASDYTPPPPLSRDESSSSSYTKSTATTTTTDIPGPEPTPPQQQPQGTVQTSPIPQSQNEILHEARRLLSHAHDDAEIFLSNPNQRTPSGNLPSLRHVIIDSQIINAFLSVQYQHSDSLAEKVAAFDTIHEEYGVRRDARSYADVFGMLRCSPRREEREEAAKECFRLWKEWEAFEKEGNEYLERVREEKGKDREWVVRRSMGLEPRLVEKVWVTSIAIMTLAGQLSIALSMLKRFAQLYPPSLIVKAILPPLPSQALIRLVPRSSHRPDPLPPHILFVDIRDLHASCALLQQGAALAYIKWLTSAYAEAIHQHRHTKLSDSKTAEGRSRSKEKKLDRELKKVSREVFEKKHPGAEDKDLGGRRGLKSLSDMERGGGFGRKPKDVKMGTVEAKIFRVWGQGALDRYLRAKRQF